MVIATVLVTAQPAAADPDFYLIRNVGNSTCLDDFARTRQVYQYPCNWQANQIWDWYQPNGVPENAWHIRNYESWTCLHPANGMLSAPLRLATCNVNNRSMKWRWVHVQGDAYMIQNVASGLCVLAPSHSGATQLTQSHCNAAYQGSLWYGQWAFSWTKKAR
jgi:hypothetical protein